MSAGAAALLALLTLVRLVSRYRKPSTEVDRLIPDAAVLRAVSRELNAVQRERESSGWTTALAALIARPGDAVRRATLVAAAWPDGAIVHDNTLDVYIARLRRKLAEIGAEQAIATGWPDGAIVHDNTLDVYVARLRRKLRALGAEMEIATVRGVGYTLR